LTDLCGKYGFVREGTHTKNTNKIQPMRSRILKLFTRRQKCSWRKKRYMGHNHFVMWCIFLNVDVLGVTFTFFKQNKVEESV
jgi:hypothetical protein